MAREDAVGLFDPVAQDRRLANAAMNLINECTGSLVRCCWVCGAHQDTRSGTEWEVLDDDAIWQPLCSVECWGQLPAPDVRWNPHRYGTEHALTGPFFTTERDYAIFRQRMTVVKETPPHPDSEWPEGDVPAGADR